MHHRFAAACALALAATSTLAKPIAWQDGYSLMAEYGAGTMREAQMFYAPRYWWSAGAGHLRMDADDGSFSRDISYVRGNLLLKRWNLPEAQGNIFAWGSAGSATGSDFDGSVFAGNLGAQADYETLRFYSSLRSEYQHSSRFANRIDTLQLGWAPYAHDWDKLATWLLVQARDYSGGLYDGGEYALLARFFGARRWGSAWFEIGATQDGKIQSMLMLNF
jgi:hypothetical protein